MRKPGFLWRPFIALGLVLGISFGIHTQWRALDGLSPMGDLLTWSYLLNFFLPLAILAFLHGLRNRMKTQLGFLFIAGSFLKFLLFFLFFYPVFTRDGVIGRSEFSSFFIPYFLALVLETYFASILLKNLERENPG
jgi:hypothetical protein